MSIREIAERLGRTRQRVWQSFGNVDGPSKRPVWRRLAASWHRPVTSSVPNHEDEPSKSDHKRYEHDKERDNDRKTVHFHVLPCTCDL